MRNIKVFDVVELKNKEKATVLNVNGNNCLVDIAGDEKRHKIININEIAEIIYRK